MGYTPDFVQYAVGPYLKDFKRKGIKLVELINFFVMLLSVKRCYLMNYAEKN